MLTDYPAPVTHVQIRLQNIMVTWDMELAFTFELLNHRQSTLHLMKMRLHYS